MANIHMLHYNGAFRLESFPRELLSDSYSMQCEQAVEGS